MTREEEYDYQEALRRIKEAKENKSVVSDLRGLSYLTRFPELASLNSLQSLNLSGCLQLSGDLRPLAGLTSLRSLNLSECPGLASRTQVAPLPQPRRVRGDSPLFPARILAANVAGPLPFWLQAG
jgi:hypothetical protein